MKRLILFFFLVISVSLFGQKKDYAVIKTGGDTIWCNNAEADTKGSGKVKSVTITTDDSTYDVLGTDVAFIISPGKTELIGDGRDQGEVLIIGTNYYMTIDHYAVIPANVSNEDPINHLPYNPPKYCVFKILDKNRKVVESEVNGLKLWKKMKVYFAENTVFVAKIDALEGNTKFFPTIDEVITMARKYNSPEKG